MAKVIECKCHKSSSARLDSHQELQSNLQTKLQAPSRCVCPFETHVHVHQSDIATKKTRQFHWISCILRSSMFNFYLLTSQNPTWRGPLANRNETRIKKRTKRCSLGGTWRFEIHQGQSVNSTYLPSLKLQ